MKKNFDIRIFLSLITISLVLSSCDDNFLDRHPTDQLSEVTFWQSEEDAMLALTGVYNEGPRYNDGPYRYTFQKSYTYIVLDGMTDNGDDKDSRTRPFTNGTLDPSYFAITWFWNSSYRNIAKTNNFLQNIGSVEMDEDKKNEMIAEVRFIRAYYYFWMSQLWGDVPLVLEVLDIDQANNISRTPKDEVIGFVLSELSEAAESLPETRPYEEDGRITKAAALAIKGRLLMSEKRWSEAADAYKQIIEMDVYMIDPRYKELFEDDGEINNEVIWALKRKAESFGDRIIQESTPFAFGGWHNWNIFKNLVDEFEMIDGKTIDESPLYDSENPYENRDPRLYALTFIPEYTMFKGRLYVAHPDSSGAPDRLPRRTWTGFALGKFSDEDYEGNMIDYGADFPVIRYAEILLSYLESKLEAGDPLTQDLLDQTINQVRQREAVNMPPVTETDSEELRKILRRERRVELAFEGLRLFDLFRWRTAHIELQGPIYGMRITNDPANYEGGYNINNEGYFFFRELDFRENVDYIWPIPQAEIDINPNLEQSPGY